MASKRRITREERGAALVEFAVVLPIFLTLLFAVAQFGMVFSQYLTLTDAVRAGARKASVSRSTANPPEAARAAVRQAAPELDLNGRITIAAADGWKRGGDVTVTATYPYDIDVLGVVVASGELSSTTTELIE